MTLNKILLSLCTLVLFFSCSEKGISIEGEIKGYNYNGKTVYLYTITSTNLDKPELLSTTTVENNSFLFKDLQEVKSIKNELPTVGLISFFDLLGNEPLLEDPSELVATLVLEEGEIKIIFDNTSVYLSGSARNDQFNNVHQAITALADFSIGLTSPYDLDEIPANAEGKDGRTQFQDLNMNLKTLTFNFAKENMTNNVGQFLFLNSYGDNMFTPSQMLELIDVSSESFKTSEEIKELKSILDQMKEKYPALEDDYEYDLSEK